MKRTKLVFVNLETGETWEHDQKSWFLNFLNFGTKKHPVLFLIGESETGQDQDGQKIKITCEAKNENTR